MPPPRQPCPESRRRTVSGARASDDVPGEIIDGRKVEDQLGVQFDADPLLKLDDEVGGGGRIETHLRKRDIGSDRGRRIVEGAGKVGEAPVADLGFARRRSRQGGHSIAASSATLYHRPGNLPRSRDSAGAGLPRPEQPSPAIVLIPSARDWLGCGGRTSSCAWSATFSLERRPDLPSLAEIVRLRGVPINRAAGERLPGSERRQKPKMCGTTTKPH